jgi:hypothetical protein
MKRFATGHRDTNHRELMDLYLALGCSAIDTTMVGGGFPDLVIGCVGDQDLVEVKFETGRIKPSQLTFNRDWRGRMPAIVRTREDVIAHVQLMRRRVIR